MALMVTFPPRGKWSANPMVTGTGQAPQSFPQTMDFRLVSLVAVAALALVSCAPDTVADRFDDTGELIALSGGDAGAVAACHTCHGLDGGGDGALVPRIAAMDTGYLVRQLGFYADGERRHPQMSRLARLLSSDDRIAVAAYYSAMPMPTRDRLPGRSASCEYGNAGAIYHSGLPERGLAACASCHGITGEGSGAGNPSLVGQSAAYHAEQLHRWRAGERYGDALGVMHDAATKLREEEIIPLSAYIADGPAPSRRRESREECP